MNISVFYVDNRAFASGKDCIRAFRVRCNITTFNIDFAAVNAEDYCILTTKITIVIACSVASFIENAIFNINYRFVFTDKSILVGRCVCHRFMSNRFVFCYYCCTCESIWIYFRLRSHAIRSSVRHPLWRHPVWRTTWGHTIRCSYRRLPCWWRTMRCTVWMCAFLCGRYRFSLFCCGYNCYVSVRLSFCC